MPEYNNWIDGNILFMRYDDPLPPMKPMTREEMVRFYETLEKLVYG